jgi:AmmeMemoRadiSam system protein A
MDFLLSSEEEQFLLKLARASITAALNGDEKYREKTFYSATLQVWCGAFVTLHNPEHELRGCIGYVEGIMPLQPAIHQLALAAAFEDPRFDPLTAEELDAIKIEISVLSPLSVIHDPQEIEVGRHGLLIRRGGQSGLLLPQVAAEYQWDRQTFLRQTCRKARLPMDAWQESTTQIQVFSAIIFSENR